MRGSSLVARGLGRWVVYRPQEEILSFGEVRVAGTTKDLRTGTHPQNSREPEAVNVANRALTWPQNLQIRQGIIVKSNGK